MRGTNACPLKPQIKEQWVPKQGQAIPAPQNQQKEESVSHDNLCSPLSTESTSDAKQPQDKKVSDAVMPETATVANQDTDPSGMDQGFTMVRAREQSPKGQMHSNANPGSILYKVMQGSVTFVFILQKVYGNRKGRTLSSEQATSRKDGFYLRAPTASIRPVTPQFHCLEAGALRHFLTSNEASGDRSIE